MQSSGNHAARSRKCVFVGWVERSDTINAGERGDGYRFAPPILRTKTADLCQPMRGLP